MCRALCAVWLPGAPSPACTPVLPRSSHASRGSPRRCALQLHNLGNRLALLVDGAGTSALSITTPWASAAMPGPRTSSQAVDVLPLACPRPAERKLSPQMLVCKAWWQNRSGQSIAKQWAAIKTLRDDKSFAPVRERGPGTTLSAQTRIDPIYLLPY